MTEWTNSVLTGDVRERLDDLPDDSVHMVMTSPPYWNLRDYGVDGQLGREETAEAFVQNLADVFDEVKRVLRPDGSLWLNLGDTYDDKDLQQIPARVALELQDRGWILRNRVTWAKPNPMPQSVKDRLNDTTEAVFHFVRSKSYWYDLDAIREAHKHYNEFKNAEEKPNRRVGTTKSEKSGVDYDGSPSRSRKEVADRFHNPAGKNPGDVFEVTTKPFPDAHFAVYPPELCEKPLKATCPPKVCAECGSPYEREVERKRPTEDDIPRTDSGYVDKDESTTMRRQNPQSRMSDTEFREWKRNNPDEFKGWTPTCDCDTDATEAGIALDPFAGAGTTLLKAKELGRQFVGIELNAKYADMARARVGIDVDDPSNVRDDADQSGLEAYEGADP